MPLPRLEEIDMSPLNSSVCAHHVALVREVETLSSRLDQQARMQGDQHIALMGAVRRLEVKQDRILEGLRIGAIVPEPEPTPVDALLGWDPDEATHPGIHPDSQDDAAEKAQQAEAMARRASEWSARAKGAARLVHSKDVALIRAETARLEAESKAKRATIAVAVTGSIAILGAVTALLKVLLGV